MSETASGTYSLPVVYTENLLASSATFRALVGAATPAEAKEHIYYDQTIDYTDEENPEEIVCQRPRGILYPDEGDGITRFGFAEWQYSNRMIVDLELVIPDEYLIQWTKQTTAEWKAANKNAKLWLWNQLGLIRDELKENSGGHDADDNPYLNTNAILATAGPIPPRTDSGETWGAVRYVLGWI